MKERFIFSEASFLVFDDSAKTLTIRTQYANDKFSFLGRKYTINYHDIVKYEMASDAVNTGETSSGALGATVGTVILGPAGAIIGGLLKRGQSKEKISELTLKICTEQDTFSIRPIITPTKIAKAQPLIQKLDSAVKKLDEIGAIDAETK